MRIQLYIDPALHPGLFHTLQIETNAKRRAALVKTFAERHLTGAQNPLCSKGPFFDAGTNSLPPHKYQFAKPVLTGLPLVSTGVSGANVLAAVLSDQMLGLVR
ncbi:hypothetical protein [Hydrogenophaga atypica]|uniref:Uncharacterized protein n=1 Tax=Hydrogenophaga atypica TaxID=249409 RepID=A0ABW2QWE2_9BURK